MSATTAIENHILTHDLPVTLEDERSSGGSPAAVIVARWHDEAHPGSYKMCQEQPCAAVRFADH